MKVALLTGLLALLLPATATGHVPAWKGPHTQGYMIINLRARVQHDLDEVRGRPVWTRPIDGWSALVARQLDVRSVERHRLDLRVAVRSLQRYLALLGDTGAWGCIHRYEGSWTDPNPPFWGGLQMDLQFQRTYGSDMLRAYGTTADGWHPYDQVIVAERARRSGRGYYPWPNTARVCGLI